MTLEGSAPLIAAEWYSAKYGIHRAVLALEHRIYEGDWFDREPESLRIYVQGLSEAAWLWLTFRIEAPPVTDGREAREILEEHGFRFHPATYRLLRANDGPMLPRMLALHLEIRDWKL